VTAYATRGNVYQYGLPRGALGNPGRLVVDSSLADTPLGTIELQEHGFETGTCITFRATDGGTLSSPLVAGVVYFAIRLTDSTFQVSATSGGSPITLTTGGVSMVVSADLPFDEVLEFYSRFVDGFLPAEVVPLTAPYPITVVAIVSELTAKKIQILSGMTSGSMTEAELGAGAQLKRWAAGLPVRDAAATTQAANVAVTNKVRGEDWIGGPLGRRNGGLWE
jgi:hypothetical protein